MDIPGLEDILIPADTVVDVSRLVGQRLGDVTINALLTAAIDAPSQRRTSGDEIALAIVEDLPDGDNFI